MKIEAYENAIRTVVPLRNNDLEDPRFDPNLTYTSEEFLSTARRLAELHKGNKFIENLVRSWEDWIGDDKSGTIRWQETSDGTTVPIRLRPLKP